MFPVRKVIEQQRLESDTQAEAAKIAQEAVEIAAAVSQPPAQPAGEAGGEAERQPTSAERLEELADLRARKLVTEEEYARKREEILKDI